MTVYRVYVDAWNHGQCTVNGHAPSRRFRYDVTADSPTQAIRRVPKTHYDDKYFYPEWLAHARVRKSEDESAGTALIWGISGVDEVSDLTLRKACMGKYHIPTNR